MTELGGDPAAAKLAAFLLLTGPGTPFLYYGEEIGMTGTKPDERIRTPMRWTAEPRGRVHHRHAVGAAVRGRRRRPSTWPPRPPTRLAADRLPRPRSACATAQPALRRGSTTCRSTRTRSRSRLAPDDRRTRAVLAIANLSDEPVAGVRAGARRRAAVRAAGRDAARRRSAAIRARPSRRPWSPPRAASRGWTPLAELAPRSGYLIELGASDRERCRRRPRGRGPPATPRSRSRPPRPAFGRARGRAAHRGRHRQLS